MNCKHPSESFFGSLVLIFNLVSLNDNWTWKVAMRTCSGFWEFEALVIKTVLIFPTNVSQMFDLIIFTLSAAYSSTEKRPPAPHSIIH